MVDQEVDQSSASVRSEQGSETRCFDVQVNRQDALSLRGELPGRGSEKGRSTNTALEGIEGNDGRAVSYERPGRCGLAPGRPFLLGEPPLNLVPTSPGRLLALAG